MNVRPATPADDDVLVAMGREFYFTLPYRDIPYCEQSARRWFAMMRDVGVLLVVEVGGRVAGMAGGLFAGCIWNDAYKVGSELLWWVHPVCRDIGAGKLLLQGLERAAVEAGCVRWSMVLTNESPPEARRMYERAGYELSEASFTKVPQWQ